MDSYVKMILKDGATDDTIIGFLSEYPFSGFEEQEEDLIAYMSIMDRALILKYILKKILVVMVNEYTIEKFPFENWNQRWEEDYPEVRIGNFCRIYAPFHGGPTQKCKYEILISPQMAFGTGHHATTEMMIRLMSHISELIHDGRGLDFGTGSGVLAILAVKMGAEHVDAIEIDEYAFDNLKDNIKLNQADWVTPYQGGSEKIPAEATYDFIVANVTRGIILEKKLKFWDHLKPGGRILISGILETDREDVISQYVDQGFYSIESMKIGKWCALMFGKRKRTKVLQGVENIR